MSPSGTLGNNFGTAPQMPTRPQRLKTRRRLPPSPITAGHECIAAMLLLHIDPRDNLYSTFCCFANMLHKRGNVSIYSFGNPFECESVIIFKKSTYKKYLPPLYLYFRSMDFSLQ
eukprot:TRINITY_DN9172_c0_g1_i1.p1 TRINITY_DN9172_c0_g1~~TRINITY_DN9172_c0_g1_i1.p1  ORF type:complete len:122 (-),score=12.73 TRINITY_DN9172_c0_g1_i1:179-523(-)